MDLKLKGKAALVTGATSGMGLGIAKVLAEEGCNVMITGFGEVKEIEKLKAEIAGKNGVKVLHDPVDLAHEDQVVQMVRNTEKAFGAVDILVNNAGIQHVALIEEFPVERWDALLAVNLTAAFHAIRTAMPGMKKRGWGRIINNASASGLAASPKKTAYTAAKFGLIGLTKAVALEVAESQITCNAICPGWVLTGMSRPQVEVIAQREGVSFEQASKILLSTQPNKRFITPEEIGRFVAYLCSEAASPITGAALSIDGGIMAG